MADKADEKVESQKKAFLRWANLYLSKKGMEIKNLNTDLSDGIMLGMLIMKVSKKRFKINMKPKNEYAQMENLNACLAFLKQEKFLLVNIGSKDILSGNEKIILGLMWTLILRYEVGDQEGKEGVLVWVQRNCAGYPKIPDVTGFSKDWTTGLPFCALINKFRPDLLDYSKLNLDDAAGCCELAFKIAAEKLGIPRMLDVADVANNPKPDEKAILPYVALLFKNFSKDKNIARLVTSIHNAVEITKRHHGLAETYATQATEVSALITAAQPKPSTSRNTAGLRAELEEFTAYRRTAKPKMAALLAQVEGTASTLANSKRNAGRPDFSPQIPLSALHSQWQQLESAELEKERLMVAKLRAFLEVDEEVASIRASSFTMQQWMNDRRAFFSIPIPEGQSVTQLESAMEILTSSNLRFKQYTGVLAAMKTSNGKVQELGKAGQHESCEPTAALVAELDKGLQEVNAQSTAYGTVLAAKLEAEKKAVLAERGFMATLEALSFDLDQLGGHSRGSLTASNTADVDKLIAVLKDSLRGSQTKAVSTEQALQTQFKTVLATRPGAAEFSAALSKESAKLAEIAKAVDVREQVLLDRVQRFRAVDELVAAIQSSCKAIGADIALHKAKYAVPVPDGLSVAQLEKEGEVIGGIETKVAAHFVELGKLKQQSNPKVQELGKAEHEACAPTAAQVVQLEIALQDVKAQGELYRSVWAQKLSMEKKAVAAEESFLATVKTQLDTLEPIMGHVQGSEVANSSVHVEQLIAKLVEMRGGVAKVKASVEQELLPQITGTGSLAKRPKTTMLTETLAKQTTKILEVHGAIDMREKSLQGKYRRYKEVDDIVTGIQASSLAMKSWIAEREAKFATPLPGYMSVTQLESEIEGLDNADLRQTMYAGVLGTMKQSESKVQELGNKGEHESCGPTSALVTSLESMLAGVKTRSGEFRAMLGKRMEEEKKAVQAERAFSSSVEAVSFDLDQLGGDVRRAVIANNTALVEQQIAALPELRSRHAASTSTMDTKLQPQVAAGSLLAGRPGAAQFVDALQKLGLKLADVKKATDERQKMLEDRFNRFKELDGLVSDIQASNTAMQTYFARRSAKFSAPLPEYMSLGQLDAEVADVAKETSNLKANENVLKDLKTKVARVQVLGVNGEQHEACAPTAALVVQLERSLQDVAAQSETFRGVLVDRTEKEKAAIAVEDSFMRNIKDLTNDLVALGGSASAPVEASTTTAVEALIAGLESLHTGEAKARGKVESELKPVISGGVAPLASRPRGTEFSNALSEQSAKLADVAAAIESREKSLQDRRRRFREVDDLGTSISASNSVMSGWIAERKAKFTTPLPAYLSVTQLESEIAVQDKVEVRMGQYFVDLESVQKRNARVQAIGKEHEQCGKIDATVASLAASLSEADTMSKAFRATLTARLEAERQAVQAERAFTASLETLSFDLDQLGGSARRAIIANSAAHVKALMEGLKSRQSECLAAKTLHDGNLQAALAKALSQRPDTAKFTASLAKESTKLTEVTNELATRDTTLKAKLQEEETRDELRAEFAVQAAALFSNLEKQKQTLATVKGTLDEQLEKIQALALRLSSEEDFVKDREAGAPARRQSLIKRLMKRSSMASSPADKTSTRALMMNLDQLAVKCDQAGILYNPETPHTIFSLQAMYDQLVQATNAEEQSLHRQIMSKKALEVTPEQLKEFADIFQTFDKDKTGFVELQELQDAVRGAGIDLNDDDVETKMEAMKPDLKFTVNDFTTFMISELKNSDTEDSVLNTFIKLAENGETVKNEQLDNAFREDPEVKKYILERMKDGNYRKFVTALFSV